MSRRIALALTLAPLAAAIVWWETPTLWIEIDPDRVVAHMELLGEYPSDIRSIEIDDDGLSAPVWKVVASGEFLQIHSVSLRAGENAGNPSLDRGTSLEIVPAPAATFRLVAGRAYRVKICPASRIGGCRSSSFVLAPR